MLHIQEIRARIEQRLGSYRQMLRAIVDDYNKMEAEREYARRAATGSPDA